MFWALLIIFIIIFFISYKNKSNYISHYKPPIRLKHPVLEYQQKASAGNHPANWGDPIRPSTIGSRPF